MSIEREKREERVKVSDYNGQYMYVWTKKS